MVAEESRGAISDREIESHIRCEQPTITPHKRYRGVSENSLFFNEKNSIRYICFNVKVRFNNLISEQNPNRFSEKQYSLYRLIKTLHDNGLGYRRISAYLNEKGFNTENGYIWKPNYVYSVLKRFKERQERIKFRNKKYKPMFSKMWEVYKKFMMMIGVSIIFVFFLYFF